jgi:hypothetical protein
VTRNEAIAANIAARITRNKTRFKFATLHRLAVEETEHMSDTSSTTSSMNVADTPATRAQIGREIPDSPASLAAVAPAKLTTDPATSPYTVGSQVTVGPIKPVDRKTITGSYPGDSRSSGDTAKATMDAIANPPAPRSQMRGQQDSRNYNENGKAFQSTSNSPDSDQGN